MTPSIDAGLRARLHRIIDEVFLAAASTYEAPLPDGSDAPLGESADPALALLGRLTELELKEQASALQVGDLTIDLAGHEVFSAGRRIRLTHREFALLRHLALHRGRACTREELVVHVWTDRTLTSARTVDIHIHRLRHKLGRPFIELLETLRNVGYKLRTSPANVTASLGQSAR